MYLFAFALLSSTGDSVKLQISSPQHGSVLDIAAGRTNGGIDLDIAILADTQAEYVSDINGRLICLYINGSIFAKDINCVATKSVQGFVLTSTLWQVGQAWLHVELFSAE